MEKYYNYNNKKRVQIYTGRNNLRGEQHQSQEKIEDIDWTWKSQPSNLGGNSSRYKKNRRIRKRIGGKIRTKGT